MPIHILSDQVSSQIAAGEVIERPSSVVKELMENAIDAGATEITVTLQGSGQPFIEVADDGQGIPENELGLAVARFATSKLQSADDLFNIQTLGFRGEALASIGSVSHLTLTSRVENAAVGGRIHVEGGKIINRSQIAHPRGTTIQVETLFFNVPARLKFLKKDFTERQASLGLLTRYALAYPSIRLKVIQDGRNMLQTNGSGNRREIIGNLFEPELARQLITVEGLDYGIRLEGFISPINVTRSNRRDITFFVNGRWVQDTTLSTALLQAYHTYLMVGRYPMAVIFLHIPPEDIDVNVHPAKAEVRFRSPDQVFSVIQRSVRKALLASSPLPQVELVRTFWYQPQSSQTQLDPAWGMAVESISAGDERPSQPPGGGDLSADAEPINGMVNRIPLLRLVGQVGAAYLVAEGPDGLYLIDQHAAHERVLYEQFIRQKDERLISQQLLEPATVHLSTSQADLLESQLALLNRLGFSVEHFGSDTFLIRSIPAIFSHLTPESALRVLVEDFEEDETPLKQELEARIVARICKRAAVKAGQVLTLEEQRQLLADLETCFSPRTCPHGRPTMIHLSVDLLERQFGRRGAR